MNRAIIWLLMLIDVPFVAVAQSLPTYFPLCGNNTSFDVPYMYVETPPSTHTNWNVCVRGEPCDGLASGGIPPNSLTPPEIQISGSIVEIKGTLRRLSFGACPPPTFHRLSIPPVSTPGPITINYFQRVVPEGVIQNPAAPYTFLATLATTATTPVPALGKSGMLLLALLTLGVGVSARRR